MKNNMISNNNIVVGRVVFISGDRLSLGPIVSQIEMLAPVMARQCLTLPTPLSSHRINNANDLSCGSYWLMEASVAQCWPMLPNVGLLKLARIELSCQLARNEIRHFTSSTEILIDIIVGQQKAR